MYAYSCYQGQESPLYDFTCTDADGLTVDLSTASAVDLLVFRYGALIDTITMTAESDPGRVTCAPGTSTDLTPGEYTAVVRATVATVTQFYPSGDPTLIVVRLGTDA